MTKAYFTVTGKIWLYDNNEVAAVVNQPIEEIIITPSNRWGIILKSQNGKMPGFLYADQIIMETI